MRILLNTRPLALSNRSGIGNYVSNLYGELIRSGLEVYPTVDSGEQTVFRTLGNISSHLRKVFGKRYPPFIRNIGDALVNRFSKNGSNRMSYDLYHETTLNPMPEIEVTRVCNLYDLTFISCPQFLPEGFRQYWRVNAEKNVAAAKRVIVNTQFIKEEAMDLLKLSGEKIDLIPLAQSSSFLERERRLSISGQVKRFIKKDYILYVGTVEPRKGLKTLIRAYREVRKKHDLSLVIAGGLGWLYSDILSYPKELGLGGDVIFTKYIDEPSLLHLYHHASVFVYPSLYEGFGLPPLEAMACGVPVVISDIPPLREVAGDAAMAFNPKDYEALVDSLEKVLSSESLRTELISKGLRKATEYSWGKVATATIQTYKKALEE